MAKLHIGNAGLNAGTISFKMMRISEIQTDPRLSSIFTIREETLEVIIKSIKEEGYDKAQPIVLWKGHNIVVDGHTRLEAAKQAGLIEVPVEEKEFESIEEAKRYTFKRQAERRNLTQAEIFIASTQLEIKTNKDGTGRSSEILAKEIGVSPSTIQKARTVEKKGDEALIDAVKNGEKTINQAYQAIKEKKISDTVDKTLNINEHNVSESNNYLNIDEQIIEDKTPSIESFSSKENMQSHYRPK